MTMRMAPHNKPLHLTAALGDSSAKVNAQLRSVQTRCLAQT